ncbi:MAG: hypothetical protein KJZ62_07925, partial [Fimbriimonadaceae bacterium]|nr:hypothetical protein [Fimbriimonadaceae bacterium]
RELYKKLGRWMQTDPLWPFDFAFRYAIANPANSIDPSGFTVDCDAECAKYKSKAVGWGGVICVGQTKCPCYWGPDAWKGTVIEECYKRHERDHFDDITCPSSGPVCQPFFDPGKNPDKEECHAYHISVKCLAEKCPNDGSVFATQCHKEKCRHCALLKKKCKAGNTIPSDKVKEICRGCGVVLP